MLKDVNRIDRGKEFELGPEMPAFLKELQAMDYSALVGIHRTWRGNCDNVRPILSASSRYSRSMYLAILREWAAPPPMHSDDHSQAASCHEPCYTPESESETSYTERVVVLVHKMV